MLGAAGAAGAASAAGAAGAAAVAGLQEPPSTATWKTLGAGVKGVAVERAGQGAVRAPSGSLQPAAASTASAVAAGAAGMAGVAGAAGAAGAAAMAAAAEHLEEGVPTGEPALQLKPSRYWPPGAP